MPLRIMIAMSARGADRSVGSGRMESWKQNALARRSGVRSGVIRVRALRGVQSTDFEAGMGWLWAYRADMMDRRVRALMAVLVDTQLYSVWGDEVFLGEVSSFRAEMEAGEK